MDVLSSFSVHWTNSEDVDLSWTSPREQKTPLLNVSLVHKVQVCLDGVSHGSKHTFRIGNLCVVGLDPVPYRSRTRNIMGWISSIDVPGNRGTVLCPASHMIVPYFFSASSPCHSKSHWCFGKSGHFEHISVSHSLTTYLMSWFVMLRNTGHRSHCLGVRSVIRHSLWNRTSLYVINRSVILVMDSWMRKQAC